jgi:Uma2 family endonuclease
MFSPEDCPIDYKPDRVYTLEAFAAFNDWLKTHEFSIADTPISHFERESDGRLVPMPQFPIEKEGAVGEIFGQLRDWNNDIRQHGVPTSSQGGFNFGAGTVRAPDVAFTPRDVYCALDGQQRSTFQGAPFSPIFAVEVDDLSTASNLNTLTSKFIDTSFPAGV